MRATCALELIAKRLGVTEHAVIAMNRRLGGDLSLNDTIDENGGSAEWQDWLVDESLDQEMTLAASEDFDKRRKALSDALGISTSATGASSRAGAWSKTRSRSRS
jgi:RNA polymerase sigma-32 factor